MTRGFASSLPVRSFGQSLLGDKLHVRPPQKSISDTDLITSTFVPQYPVYSFLPARSPLPLAHCPRFLTLEPPSLLPPTMSSSPSPPRAVGFADEPDWYDDDDDMEYQPDEDEDEDEDEDDAHEAAIEEFFGWIS